jgi:L-amino acid N-acyltransferase YncA
MPEPPRVRAAVAPDAERIAQIWAEGIEERVATFETRPPETGEVRELIAADAPLLVADRAGELMGFAKLGRYDDPHDYYAGVGEATLYVAPQGRRQGVGRALLEALAGEAQSRGYHKLIGKIFTSNRPSLELVQACGWREVGVHHRHGRLDGRWKDVVVVEKLLGEAAA